MSKLITQKRKCPICKKQKTYTGRVTMGFFMIEDSSNFYIIPYCTKECLEEAKKRGLWK